MILTKYNYFSTEANQTYMSVSQFKQFRECEAMAMAEIRGEYERPKSEAFLEGGYVDAHFSGTLAEYLADHPEMLNKRTGELRAPFLKARAAIERAMKDRMFMQFMDGRRQVIMTGELFGIQWKAKPDFLQRDKIVDLKYMRDTQPIWKDGERKTFIDAYGYDIQGYVYQELVHQQLGIHLPFYLAVITKEDPADLQIIEIPQWKLNSCAEIVKHYAQRFDKIKAGEIAPERCESCAYCRGSKVLDHVTNYEDLLDEIGG